MSEAQIEGDGVSFVRGVVEDLLERLGIMGTVDVSSAGDGTCRVQIESEEAGILIGRRGETIGALQSIVEQIVYNRKQIVQDKGALGLGEFHLVLDVGDWRERREDVLRSLALGAVAKVKETHEAQHIYDLSPSERRFVHILLSSEPGVVTESEGEGRDRHLVIKPCG